MVDILTLRRETKVSELFNSFPTPDGALPKQMMPGWEAVPLNEKLPMYKCPVKASFSRNCVGKKIWRKHPIKSIATYDPHTIFYNFEYNPLHDTHLRKFFTKPINEERILTHFLVNDQNGVVCDLKSFNNFRKYLFELLLIRVHAKIKEMDKEDMLKLKLNQIQKTFQKRAHIAFKKSIMRPREEILAEKARNRKKFLENMQLKYNSAIWAHEMNKMLEFEDIQTRARIRTKFMKRRQEMLREKERRRRINLILRLQDKSQHHYEVLMKRMMKNHENKANRTFERWQSLLISRKNNQVLTQLLIQSNERQIKANIQKRREKLEIAMKRTNEKFMQYKADQVRKRYRHYHKDNVKTAMHSGIKAIVKKKQQSRRRMQNKKHQKSLSSFSSDSNEFVSEEKLVVISEPRIMRTTPEPSQASFYSITASKNVPYLDDDLESVPSQEKALDGLSRSTINSAVDKAFEAFEYLKSVKSNLSVLETAKQILQSVIETPDNKLPFDDAVVKYAQQRVKATMETVKIEVVQELEKIIISNKKTLCGNSSKMTLSQTTKTKTKSVLFTDEKKIKILESDTSQVRLKSVKNRVPTPTTSLENLVSIVMKSDTEELEIPHESNTLDLIHLSKAQKLLMERNCDLFKKLLKQNLLQRCLAAIDLKTMEVIMRINPDLIGVDREYLIEIMAESILHLPTEDLQFGSNLRLATNVLTTEILVELRLVLHEVRKCKDVTCISCYNQSNRKKSETID